MGNQAITSARAALSDQALPNYPMNIEYKGIRFEIEFSGAWKIHFMAIDSQNRPLWECTLEAINDQGDYFQSTLVRHDKEQNHFSYTALFHELVRTHRDELSLIRSIYSTPYGGNVFTLKARQFWDKQVQVGLAVHLPSESRYRASFEPD